MTENQKEAVLKIQDLMLKIRQVIRDHELEQEYIGCLAVGFIDKDSIHIDENGEEAARMSLVSAIDVDSEEELEDILSYCHTVYQMEKEEEEKEENPKEGTIDWWLKNLGGNNSIN